MKAALAIAAYFALCLFASLFDAVILGRRGEGCDPADKADFLAD